MSKRQEVLQAAIENPRAGDADIAELVGCSRQYVHRTLKAAGVVREDPTEISIVRTFGGVVDTPSTSTAAFLVVAAVHHRGGRALVVDGDVIVQRQPKAGRVVRGVRYLVKVGPWDGAPTKKKLESMGIFGIATVALGAPVVFYPELP